MPAVASNSTQELSLLPCDAELCHSNGRCFVLNERINCECWLGYTGPFCEDRVNKSISIPLTLGVLGCIVGFVALAFLLAFLKRRAVVYKRKPAAASKEASKMDPSKDPL